MSKRLVFTWLCCCVLANMPVSAIAQSIQPYPNAITDRLFHAKAPMLPPPVNKVFADPDFGSLMVRVTDQNTDPKPPSGYFYDSSGATNEWSADGRKFFVIGQNSHDLAFAFDPSKMAISSLPPAPAGQGLPIPLRPYATFSFLDSDLMFGTTFAAPLTISQYRFSTNTVTPILDVTTCATQPPLQKGSNFSSDGMSISADDSRFVVSAGGKQFGKNFVVVVYDTKLGCRWYNTQTGQIGGPWGQTGSVSIPDRYPIRHTGLSGSGRYVRIGVDGPIGFYVWDTATLTVTPCLSGGRKNGCTEYGDMGENSWVSEAGVGDEMNTLKWPLGNLAGVTRITGLPLPHYWGNIRHFTWKPGHLDDNAPVCGNTYSYDGDIKVTQPYDGEIFCIETDGLASTIWRFGHNRAVWNPAYFYTDPFGSISLDGNFLLFSSTWDGQVGTTPTGAPRSDIWIVRLR